MNRRAHRLLLAALVVGLVVRCGSPTLEFSPEQDNAAMAHIERSWSGSVGSGPIGLSFCEDIAANDAATAAEDSCQVLHTVRGEGRTVARTEEGKGGVGCGGCPFAVNTRVVATVVLPTGDIAIMDGTIRLGDGYEDNPYVGDWGFQLTAREGKPDEPPMVLEGRILQNGDLLLSGPKLNAAGLSESLDDVEIPTHGAASCGQ